MNDLIFDPKQLVFHTVKNELKDYFTRGNMIQFCVYDFVFYSLSESEEMVANLKSMARNVLQSEIKGRGRRFLSRTRNRRTEDVKEK